MNDREREKKREEEGEIERGPKIKIPNALTNSNSVNLI